MLMCGHTFLYSPPVRAVKELLEREELGEIFFISSSRVNLGLHQRDVSVSGTSARTTSRSSCYWLGELPTHGARRRPRLDRPGHPRRRVRHPRLPVGDRRERRAELARAEQAAAHRDRRQREDGRLRRRTAGAGPDLRPRRRLQGPGDVRRVPPLLPHRRHRLAEARGVRAARSRSSRTSCSAIRNGGETVASAGLASDVVRLTEAADDLAASAAAPRSQSTPASLRGRDRNGARHP